MSLKTKPASRPATIWKWTESLSPVWDKPNELTSPPAWKCQTAEIGDRHSVVAQRYQWREKSRECPACQQTQRKLKIFMERVPWEILFSQKVKMEIHPRSLEKHIEMVERKAKLNKAKPLDAWGRDIVWNSEVCLKVRETYRGWSLGGGMAWKCREDF